jgi:hypothetical protein
VEVKGSSLEISTVELTINEISHAESFQPTDLVVVDDIEWSRNADGSVTTAGGRLRVWRDWTPQDDALEPRKFAYSLPPAGMAWSQNNLTECPLSDGLRRAQRGGSGVSGVRLECLGWSLTHKRFRTQL